jgi:hypothetical protein
MARFASRASLAAILTGLLVAVSAAIATGHETPEAPEPLPDVAVLEALCITNTDEADDEHTCLDVVHRFLAPRSDPRDPGSEVYRLGDAQPREGAQVTLAEMHWSPRQVRVPLSPGNTLVAIMVRYQAVADGIDYATGYWRAIGEDGRSYEAYTDYVPALESGELAPGEEAEGWVTFEVPRSMQLIEVLESRDDGEDLRWALPQ